MKISVDFEQSLTIKNALVEIFLNKYRKNWNDTSQCDKYIQ